MIREELELATKKLMDMIKVSEIMTSPVKTVVVDAPFSEVEELFVGGCIRHLPVVDKEEKLVGIITQKDLYKLISPRKVASQVFEYDSDKILDGDTYYSKEVLDSFILNNVMTKDVCSFGVDRSFGEALRLMVQMNINSIVIVDDDKKVVGIVTSVDLMNDADRIFAGKK